LVNMIIPFTPDPFPLTNNLILFQEVNR
jgi:hypothetical protein